MELVIIALFILVSCASWVQSVTSSRAAALERRLDRLDRRLDLIMDHLGLEEPPIPGLDRVQALVAEGKSIEAIKVYRQLTGAGLKEAKEAVEALPRI
ncbi:ribosomal protein L7/L12 [Streptomyces sp. NPDC006879]|uniref:ribosomal protein L7/L12 n=1 Tax=Streptomyces sp. NPDC006879 TaxID=3364767 RepID=UPI0036C9FC68